MRMSVHCAPCGRAPCGRPAGCPAPVASRVAAAGNRRGAAHGWLPRSSSRPSRCQALRAHPARVGPLRHAGWAPSWPVDLPVSVASDFTSAATTVNPLPALPARRLDSGVERQQIGLLGNAVDHTHDRADVVGAAASASMMSRDAVARALRHCWQPSRARPARQCRRWPR